MAGHADDLNRQIFTETDVLSSLRQAHTVWWGHRCLGRRQLYHEPSARRTGRLGIGPSFCEPGHGMVCAGAMPSRGAASQSSDGGIAAGRPCLSPRTRTDPRRLSPSSTGPFCGHLVAILAV